MGILLGILFIIILAPAILVALVVLAIKARRYKPRQSRDVIEGEVIKEIDHTPPRQH